MTEECVDEMCAGSELDRMASLVAGFDETRPVSTDLATAMEALDRMEGSSVLSRNPTRSLRFSNKCEIWDVDRLTEALSLGETRPLAAARALAKIYVRQENEGRSV